MTLANLSFGNADNQVRIVSSDGIDHIYAAMAAHVGVPEVQGSACMVLNNLLLSPVNLPALKAGGRASAALRAALAAHPAHADIRQWAPKVFARLA